MHDSRITMEDLTPVTKRLAVEVPADEVQAQLDRAFQRLGRQARLPGFRPGKVPRLMLDRMFGAEVRREVVGHLVEETLRHAVEERGLDVVGTPDVDTDALTPGEALRYRVTLEVRPPITLGETAGLEVARPATEVSDADVDRVLEAMRESAAQLRPIEDRAVVEAGDIVMVDLTSRLEGGEPSRREGVLLEAGAGSFPLALERQLVGQHRGAQLTVRVPYPAEHTSATLAGRTVEFDVAVRELRTKELPPLDDDLARDHGQCDSLDELRARVREDLERESAARADAAVREGLVERLLEMHSFDAPPTLVERRAEALASSLEIPPNVDREQAMRTVLEQVRPRAERQVRAELLLDAVIARDRVTVTEAEIAGAVEAMVARQTSDGERVRELYARPEARAALAARMRRERALDGVVASARVVPQQGDASVARDSQSR